MKGEMEDGDGRESGWRRYREQIGEDWDSRLN